MSIVELATKQNAEIIILRRKRKIVKKKKECWRERRTNEIEKRYGNYTMKQADYAKTLLF